jgi:hypothetical protein
MCRTSIEILPVTNGRNCVLAAVLLIYTSVVNTLQIAPPVASIAVAEAKVAVAGVGMLIVARMGAAVVAVMQSEIRNKNLVLLLPPRRPLRPKLLNMTPIFQM